MTTFLNHSSDEMMDDELIIKSGISIKINYHFVSGLEFVVIRCGQNILFYKETMNLILVELK